MNDGQIIAGTERYDIIKKTINEFNPKTILEIGTWKGMGSTKCILDCISEGVEFYSLESNKEFFDIAKNNLKEYDNKFNQIFGKIIETEQVIDYVKDYTLSKDEETWLEEDILNFKSCDNVINLIPEKIDLLLLDGGEFSTYLEWLILKERVKIVMLDDIDVFKCKRIYEELIKNTNYSLLYKTEEGNGFCVFKQY